jgi:hypothetical protein
MSRCIIAEMNLFYLHSEMLNIEIKCLEVKFNIVNII